ncbi:hypothetical protein M446_2422 [Methylobacterium sp. 4-46]|uniref:hypothetical protein n=1 Tax=unclassified Methylobacterium TaxID=2615210 RepID=UPI000152C2E1|nr:MULTISPECIES: hypothetical protein [Methylobacterium]ACA16878.1 hypothetical protein M446_2422 [Methylobacterium sp. 4-46]WFT82569.1 hypothetical protein QA634_12265 [Methylobacterium nodulans]
MLREIKTKQEIASLLRERLSDAGLGHLVEISVVPVTGWNRYDPDFQLIVNDPCEAIARAILCETKKMLSQLCGEYDVCRGGEQ